LESLGKIHLNNSPLIFHRRYNHDQFDDTDAIILMYLIAGVIVCITFLCVCLVVKKKAADKQKQKAAIQNKLLGENEAFNPKRTIL